MVGVGFAANEVSAPSASASQAVKGEVLMITDECLVVKEPTGKGLQLFFDKGTKRDTTIKAGDKIEAQVSPDGHAKSITIVNSASERAEKWKIELAFGAPTLRARGCT